ncbi:gliding motility-associated C-terminal domain-containing protein [Aquimarina agarilytica]|uniref:gliding motility-associated C-terminal domain-containing protein n=1 Tax=Aquimarina agarilytica TaxID=1087449 RepID=UPI0002899E83|nr:gliding motility-associated C-terminal domain-containing protein [Aquimarina agarilytica]
MKTIYFPFLLVLFSALSGIAQVTCDIKNHENSSIRSHSDNQIGIYGNLINDGEFTENGDTSEVGFYNNDNPLTISGNNAPEFANLIVDVNQNINLEINTIVTTGVFFVNGNVVTPRSSPETSLDLVNTDLYVNEGDDTHVDGYTSYTGNDQYLFPVGDAFRLRPISVQATAAENTSKAGYFFENPDTPSTFPTNFDRSQKENEIAFVSPVEFWDLDGNKTTRATLTWDPMSNISDLVVDNDITELIVVGWSKEEEQWVNLGNANTSGDILNGKITSGFFNPDDYEVLTIAGTEILDSNEELVFFNAVSSDENGENDYFKIQGINKYPNNTLKIFNRWGVVVYSKDGYNDPDPQGTGNSEFGSFDVFTGKSNGRATIKPNELLPVGTYYYILDYEVGPQGGRKCKSGYLYVNR